jgi:hypothetical protein
MKMTINIEGTSVGGTLMKKLTLPQRKWLLIIHLVFVAIWFGDTMVFLILSIIGASTVDENILKASYSSMHLIANTSGKASIFGTVITGILLSVFTHWGLFKYKWIIVKEALTIISIGLGLVGIYYWTLKAFTMVSTEGLEAMQNQVFITNNYQLYIGIILQIISLLSMIIISVFKPWGKRKQAK